MPGDVGLLLPFPLISKPTGLGRAATAARLGLLLLTLGGVVLLLLSLTAKDYPPLLQVGILLGTLSIGRLLFRLPRKETRLQGER